MNELYDVLKTSKASDFLIREEQTESREAFFIGQKLDMSRAKKVTHTFLTVFAWNCKNVQNRGFILYLQICLMFL